VLACRRSVSLKSRYSNASQQLTEAAPVLHVSTVHPKLPFTATTPSGGQAGHQPSSAAGPARASFVGRSSHAVGASASASSRQPN
jgi:hypothetical protein